MRFAFVASDASVAQQAWRKLVERYGDVPPEQAELIVALGGDVFDFDQHRIDAMASRLRRKAEKLGMRLPVRSVRGTGYVFAT